jgi:hypothetical protein
MDLYTKNTTHDTRKLSEIPEQNHQPSFSHGYTTPNELQPTTNEYQANSPRTLIMQKRKNTNQKENRNEEQHEKPTKKQHHTNSTESSSPIFHLGRTLIAANNIKDQGDLSGDILSPMRTPAFRDETLTKLIEKIRQQTVNNNNHLQTKNPFDFRDRGPIHASQPWLSRLAGKTG